MSPHIRNLTLFALNVGIWGLCALSYNGSIRLLAKAGIPVSLEIQPTRAKLTINGKRWEGTDGSNGWIQSPATLYLPIGQHKVTLERPGYATHTFKVLLEPGNEKLELKTELEALDGANHELEILSSTNDLEDVTATLDQGLEAGPLPLKADDLTPGLHILELRATGLDSFRIKPYVCLFEILPDSSTPFTIRVSRSGKKYLVSDCKRLKKIQ